MEDVGKARQKRNESLTLILAAIYGAGKGDIHYLAAVSQVESLANVEPGSSEDLLQELQARGMIRLEAGNTVGLEMVGLLVVEHEFQDMLTKHSRRDIKASRFGDSCGLLLGLCWQRFRLLVEVYEMCAGKVAQWVAFEDARTRAGLTEDEYWKAADHGEAQHWIELPAAQMICLTVAGRDHIESEITILNEAYQGAMPSESEYAKILVERWKAEETPPVQSPEPDYPADYFKDDGVWLTASIASGRYGIPDSRFKEWRESFCPALRRRLAARNVPDVGWAYSRVDIQEICERRTERTSKNNRLKRLGEFVQEHPVWSPEDDD